MTADASRPWACAACPRPIRDARDGGSRMPWCCARRAAGRAGFGRLMDAYNGQASAPARWRWGWRRGPMSTPWPAPGPPAVGRPIAEFQGLAWMLGTCRSRWRRRGRLNLARRALGRAERLPGPAGRRPGEGDGADMAIRCQQCACRCGGAAGYFARQPDGALRARRADVRPSRAGTRRCCGHRWRSRSSAASCRRTRDRLRPDSLRRRRRGRAE